MVDLILPRRSRAPSSPKKQSSSSHKTEVPAAPRQRLQGPSDGNIVGKVSRSIKGANDLLLYWKDGLSADERALLRKKEERKQVLTLRMKSVRHLNRPMFPRCQFFYPTCPRLLTRIAGCRLKR